MFSFDTQMENPTAKCRWVYSGWPDEFGSALVWMVWVVMCTESNKIEFLLMCCYCSILWISFNMCYCYSKYLLVGAHRFLQRHWSRSDLTLNPSISAHSLCELGRVTYCFWACPRRTCGKHGHCPGGKKSGLFVFLILIWLIVKI